MKSLVVICVAFALFTWNMACTHASSYKPMTSKMPKPVLSKLTWFHPEAPSSASAVIVHGLNTNPLKMHSIIDLLNDSGISVLRVALAGHRGDIQDLKTVSREIWLSEVREAYEEGRKFADDNHLPLYFIGYSLGALLNADLLTQNAQIQYDKMVLFAPALATRWYTRLILSLGIFGSEYIIPSGSPLLYRANLGTPIAAYQALFESKSVVRHSGFRNLNIPTLVFLDKDDELVSPGSLENAVRRFELSRWRIELVDTAESRVIPHYHHLIIDEDCVGGDEWLAIAAKLQEFLRCERTS